jgi:hypothetical protein
MNSNLKPLVDELGAIKAQIADLEIREKKLRDQLVAIGPGAYDGDNYRATVSSSERDTLDMKAVREKLTKQFIRAHTSTTEVTTVRVDARIAEEVV